MAMLLGTCVYWREGWASQAGQGLPWLQVWECTVLTVTATFTVIIKYKIIFIKGQVMEFHDIYPSKWAYFCRFSDMSLLFYGWRVYSYLFVFFQRRGPKCSWKVPLSNRQPCFLYGQIHPNYVTHPWHRLFWFWFQFNSAILPHTSCAYLQIPRPYPTHSFDFY